MRHLIGSASLVLLLFACEGGGGVDAGRPRDASASDAGARDAGRADAGAMDAGATDAGPMDASATDAGVMDASAMDAGATDAGPMDAGATDAGPMDAGPMGFDADFPRADGGASCHGYTFGGPVVNIEAMPNPPPVAIGGTIPLGIYDLVRVQYFGGSLTGQMRSTFVFEDATTMHELNAIDLSGSGLPTPTPRRRTWHTAGTRIMSERVCGGSDSFDNEYSVRPLAGGGVAVDILASASPGLTLVITLERR